MKIFERLSNGWKLGMMSLKTIKNNPALMLFPVISSISLILIVASFMGGGYFIFGEQALAILADDTSSTGNIMAYIGVFLFYLVNYFVVVFFNVGLVHCAKTILEGGETSFGEGVRYAQTRIGAIFAWAALAATVGLILKIIQERSGTVGQVISGLIGMVWAIATFFVVPVIAYENVSPIEAVKRSSQIMRDKWGESLGSNFSFGLFSLIGILLIAIPIGITGFFIHPAVGIIGGITAIMLVSTAVSAAKMVFLAATYQRINHAPIGHFDPNLLDDAFVQK